MMRRFFLILLCAAFFSVGALWASVVWDEYPMEYFYELLEDNDIPSEEWPARTGAYRSIGDGYRQFFEAFQTDEEVKVTYGFEDYFISDYDTELGPVLEIYYPDHVFLMCGISLENDEIHGICDLYTLGALEMYDLVEYDEEEDVHPYSCVRFPDFILKKDGTVVSGISNEEDENSYESGFSLILMEAYLEQREEGLVIVSEDPCVYASIVTVNDDGEEDYLRLNRFETDMLGNILVCDFSDEPQRVFMEDQYECLLEGIEFSDEGILASGTFAIPELNYSITLQEKDMLIGAGYWCDISLDVKNHPATFTYEGFELKADGVQLGSGGRVMFYNTCLMFNGSEIPLGNAYLTSDYYYYEDGWEEYLSMYRIEKNVDDDGIQVHVFTDDDVLRNVTWMDGCFRGYVSVQLPGNFNTRGMTVNVILNPDGTVQSDYYSSYSYGSYSRGNIDFRYDYSGLDDDGFWFDTVSIGLPANGVLRGLVQRYMSIDFEGNVRDVDSYWGYPFDGPARLCGMTFSADSLEYGEDSFTVSGTLYLPDSFPCYYNRMEAVAEIGYDGALKDFSAEMQGVYSMKVGDSFWNIRTDGMHLEITQNVNADGSLAPAVCRVVLNDPVMYVYYNRIYNAENIELENASYLYSGGKWELEYDKLAIEEPAKILIGDMSFLIESVSADPDDFAFSGTYSFGTDSTVPELFRGMTGRGLLILSDDGSIKDCNAKFPAVSGSFSTKDNPNWSFTVEDVRPRLVVDQGNNPFRMTLSGGSLSYEEGCAEILEMSEPSITEFGYDVSARKITLFHAESETFSAEGIVPAIVDMKTSIDLTSITVEGTIPDAEGQVEEYFGKPAVDVRGSMKYDSEGNPESFTMEYRF